MAIGPIILDIAGLSLTAEDKELLRHPHVGGVIFFNRNFESPQQITELSHAIKAINPQLVLCVDQEGGRVQRFKNGFSRLPRLRVLGELLETQSYPFHEVLKISEKLGQMMALEVRSVGVDLSFAPVLDLDKGLSEVIGDRAFHTHPDRVSQLAAAYIKGMANAGMKATGKHFPGHGSVRADSHFAIPVDTRSLAEITPDLTPFKYLIHEGIAAFMPAHIVFSQIDPLPVGFSSYWLQTVLRKELGFQGTIVSDDLTMEGASGMGSYPERAQRALDAGCDFLLVCNNREAAMQVVAGITPPQDEISQHRRLNLLAKGDIPPWSELQYSVLWQEGAEALKLIQQFESHKVV